MPNQSKLLNLLAIAALAFTTAACGGGKSSKQDSAKTTSCDQPAPANPQLSKADALPATGGNFYARLEWPCPLASDAELPARLTFADKNLALPTSVDGLAIDPWMPSMGHGSITDYQTMTRNASLANVYDVTGILFTMGGKWLLKVTATVNGATDEVAFPVDIP